MARRTNVRLAAATVAGITLLLLVFLHYSQIPISQTHPSPDSSSKRLSGFDHFEHTSSAAWLEQGVGKSSSATNVKLAEVLNPFQSPKDLSKAVTSIDGDAVTNKASGHGLGNHSLDFGYDALLRLQKRANDIEFTSKSQYHEFRSKGAWLRCILATPAVAGANANSKWAEIDQLRTWGWVDKTPDDDREVDFSDTDGMSELVGSAKGQEYEWKHELEYQGHALSAEDYPVRRALIAYLAAC